ncbi:MAG: PAS domain S-box protein [Planctomycetes bacterium]|nr:PAS domain S-box protein [Planctomycetota bacterium]
MYDKIITNPNKPFLLNTRKNVIVALRLIVFAIIYLILLQERGLKNLPVAFWVITLLFGLSELVYIFERQTHFLLQRILGWIFIFDAVLIGLIIYFLSVKSTLLFITYFSVIAIAAISKSVRMAFIITFLISAFYLFISFEQGDFVLTEFLTRPLFFFGVAIFASYLSEESATHRKEQKKTEGILENTPYVGSYQSTLDGNFIYVNEAFAKMLEYDSAEELKRVKVISIYKNPENRKRFIKALKKDGQINNFEAELLTKTGKTRNILINGILDGEIISGVDMDITRLKQTEETLRESQRQIEFIIGAAKTELDIIDREFNLHYVDPGCAKRTGDWKGRKCYEYYMNRSKPCSNCDAPKAFETKQILTREDSLAHNNNIYTHVTSIPYQNKNGEWLLAQVNVDITERKKMENALLESQGQLQMVLRTANIEIDIIDEQFNLHYVDSEWLKKAGGWQGRKCYEYYWGRTDLCPHCEALETFESKKPFILESPAANNPDKYVLITGIPYQDKNGKWLLAQITMDITARKKAENALLESQRQIEFILGAAKTRLDIIDSQFNLRYVDPEWSKILGNWAGRKCYDYVMHRKEPCTTCNAPKAFETKQILVIEGGLNDGTGMPTLVTSIPYQDKNGEWLVAQVSVDITERKKMEKVMNESEARFRGFFESSSVGMIMTDLNAQFVLVNPAACRILGYTKEELMAKTFADITYKDDSFRAMENIAKLLDGTIGSYMAERRYVHKDGQLIWGQLNVALVRDSNNNPLHFICQLYDITERKTTEESLKLSEEKYRTIIENTVDIIYSTNIEGEVTFVSSQCASLGYKPEEIIGKPISYFIHPEDVKRVLDDLQKAFRTGEMFPVNFRLLKKDNSFVYAEEIGKIIESPDGKVNYMGVIRDITQQRKLEEQLMQSQKMEAVGRLAGGIAHDFNNILAVINGYCSLSMDNLKENDPIKGDMEEILKASEKATMLTQQLLSFSRKQMIRSKIINLNTLIMDTGKMLKRIISENIKLVTIMEEDLKDISADPTQMEQVIINMVVNARDAMPEGGTLSIKTENIRLDEDSIKVIPESRSGEFVRLSIQDTGVGMSKETIEHAFEPFFTTKEYGKGTGLGLATVYGIVKQHKGWVNIYSEQGKGTIFNIYLPVAAEKGEEPATGMDKTSSHAPTAQHSVGMDKQNQSKRILLVEDEEGVREFILRTLTNNNYQVFKAKTAGEALDIFNREKGDFDLVFSDIVLPDKNGVQMVLDFLAIKPALNIILSSGYADEKSQWPVIEEKGLQFIQKPYTTPELLKMIKETIKS